LSKSAGSGPYESSRNSLPSPDPDLAAELLVSDSGSPFDDFETLRARNTAAFAAVARPKRLKRLPSHFVRVPLPWLLTPRAGCPIEPGARLFLYVLYRSHFGQRGVKVTTATAAQFGLSARTKNRCFEAWENAGWIRTERTGRGSPIIWPIVIVG
jgi:hypothetical protein